LTFSNAASNVDGIVVSLSLMTLLLNDINTKVTLLSILSSAGQEGKQEIAKKLIGTYKELK
jgi:hypothetical protein